MDEHDNSQDNAAPSAPPATAPTAADHIAGVSKMVERPRLGEVVQVTVAPGMRLINSELGNYFAEGVPTRQTVTLTLLRRLDDGDLVLA